MIKKRFVQNNDLVMQDGEVYVVCGDEHSADVVTTALNEIIYQNEQLKKDLKLQKELREIEIGGNLELQYENEQLREKISELENLISKIDFAIIRKYDNSLENILDEVYDGEYNKWIEKQVSRSKKL